MQLAETHDVIDKIFIFNIRSVTSLFKTNCVFNVYRLARVIELTILILVTEVSYLFFSSLYVKKNSKPLNHLFVRLVAYLGALSWYNLHYLSI